jgi:allophanate hydrolase
MCATQYSNLDTRMSTSMNPIKTLGWTLAEWQAGYANNTIQLENLYALVEQFDHADPAWISIASKEQLTAQIDALKHIENATALPLFGVPVAVKDNIDVAGFASTAAFKLFTELKTDDAYVVQRLKQAGAIVVGKTNLDQFATGLVGTRSPFGAVPNTFNKDYVSGGSSSGSGSVVARGLVPISLGTDTAGSGRIPAAFNNIVGLKPTKGRFSNTGLLPACKSIDCISIFALTVADATTVANIMEGFDVQDSYSRVNPATAPAKLSAQLKLAIPKQLEFFGDTQSADAFQQALIQLKNLGADITEIDFSAFSQLASQLYQGSWVAERTAAVADLLETSVQDFDPTVLEIIAKGQHYSAVDAYNAEYLKQELARDIQQTLAQFDALVVPSSPTIHTLAEMAEAPIENNSHFGTYTNFTNLADLSAIAVPAGFRADGLPFGITLIAPAWHDTALADFAQTWQNHLQLPLGALNKKLPESPVAISAPSAQHFRVAVVGAHLTGMPLNFQLTTRQAVHVETTTTSADYALFALPGTVPPKPGLARQDEGQHIIVELWDIPKARFGEFVAEIPTPLGMGNVELADGRWVKGFICEPYGLNGAKNISEFGGWRAYIQSLQHTTA